VAPAGLLALTRRQKLDVPRRLATLPLPYPVVTLVVGDTPSIVHTLDAAWPFTRGRRIAFGFPDVLLEPREVFGELLTAQAGRGASVVLGVFPAAEPERSDLVELEPDGRLRRLAVKEPAAGLTLTWMTAVWTAELTEFLHRFLRDARSHPGGDLQVGHVLQAALRSGMRVDAVVFPHGRVLDIGTPHALAAAPAWLAARHGDRT
jgi:glucose-1-phosphate thymidylyltransferase